MSLKIGMRTWLAALAACTGLCCSSGAQAQLAAPANDLCGGATVLSLNNAVYGSAITASAENDGPNSSCQNTSGARGVWFTFTPSITQLYQVSACHSTYDTILQIFTAVDCTTFSDAAFARLPNGCNDDQCGGGPGPGATGAGTGSVINNITLNAGQQYWFRLSAFSTPGYYQMAVYDYGTSGACCSNAGVCTIASPSQCAAIDSTFIYMGNGTTCTVNPCVGACCDNTTNACSITRPGASSSGCFHGFFQGFGSTCSPNPCGLGTCCTVLGSCSVVQRFQCAAISAWNPLQTSCTVSNCNNSTIGACCNTTTGACAVFAAGCPSGTVFRGFGTTCSGTCTSGACCTVAGACSVTFDPLGCVGTSRWLPGGTCTVNPCSQACCTTATGACAVVTGAACPTGTTTAGSGSSCTPDLCALQACCAPAGTCTLVPLAACVGTSAPQGAGSTCTVNPCTAQLGACCSSTGTCSLTMPGNGCIGTSTFQGTGTICTTNPCTAQLRACCSSSGTCSLTMYNGCESTATSVWRSADTSCTVNPCTATLGACCSSTGACSLTIATGCTGTSTFQTVGSVCTTNPCTAQLGACCSSTGTCSLTMQFGCTGTSTFQTVGSTCTTNPCTSQLGACCSIAGTCSLTMPGNACISGISFTPAGVCTPNPCGFACCSSAGVCSVVANGSSCSGVAGVAGSSCTPDPCPAQFANCCTNNACTIRLPATCTSSGGTPGALGSTCSPYPCFVGLASVCENFDSLTTPALPSGWTSAVPTGAGAQWTTVSTSSNSAPNSVFTNDIATVSDQILTMPAVTAGGNLFLQLFSSFTTESTFDGWTVEASVNGSSFANIGDAAWLVNGYNATISANFSSPILGQRAFSGAAAAWTERVARITANAGDSVVIRFRMASDTSTASTGVNLDNICVYNIQVGQGACCTDNGSCSLTANNACATPSFFQGVGTTCNAGLCPTPVTACCNTTTGACVFINGVTCGSGSVANGISCNPSTCPQTGACCANTGVCSLTSAAGCTSGSLFQGLGTSCNAGACPVATSACCNAFGGCTFIAGATCPSGSTPSGSGVCSPNTCVGVPSVCENFDGIATGSLPSGWTANVTGVAPNSPAWTVVNTQANSLPNSVFTTGVDHVQSSFLTLPTVTAGGPLTLDFMRYFFMENATTAFDGWVVEVSINGGAYANIGLAAWTVGGYNAVIDNTFNSEIGGQDAFSKDVRTWTQSTAIIPAASGDSVSIRFRMCSDSSIAPAGSGVWIDNLCVGGLFVPPSGVCCRGATCNTTITSAAACSATLIPMQTAGANFASGSTCNSGPLTNSPCCYADYNKVGGLNITDIFDFLNDWFAGSPFANVGGDGTSNALTVTNIFDFLNDWFTGGCQP